MNLDLIPHQSRLFIYRWINKGTQLFTKDLLSFYYVISTLENCTYNGE